ncbi:MAG: hypothetical protein AAGC56_15050 [Pseudomonadota bacterium]
MALVEDVIASVHDENVAYAVFDNHKKGDYAPYVLKTADRGKTWTAIVGDLPERGSAHTIAEDHVNANLLFVGTEFGLFATQDGGASWSRMKKGLPTIAVRDLEIQRRENDLVVGTFGRGVYIVDDYTPLRTPLKDVADDEATLFAVKDPWLYIEGDLWGGWGGAQAFNGDNFYFAENPPFGAVFTYRLKDGLKTKAEARREAERKIAKESGDTPYPSWEALRAEDREAAPQIVLTVRDAAGAVVRRIDGPKGAGLHRVTWDLRYDNPAPVTLGDEGGSLFSSRPVGPLATPGEYVVQLAKRIAGVETALGEPQRFTVKPLKRSPEATANRPALLAFQQETSDLSRRVFAAGARLADVGDRIAHLEQALDRTPKAQSAHFKALAALKTRHDDIGAGLNGDGTLSSRNEPAPWSVGGRLGYVRGASWRAQSAPAAVHREAVAVAGKEFAALNPKLDALVKDLAAFETDLAALGAPWTPGQGSQPVAPGK